MLQIYFQTTLEPDAADTAFVQQQLRAYNSKSAGEFTRKKMAVFARDERSQIIGGATGEVHWSWLHVDLLWVHHDHRANGVGSKLLKEIEKLADEVGVTGYHLGTTSFQALPFYQKCGYQIWGELADFPPGHTNYSLCKYRFAQGTGADK